VDARAEHVCGPPVRVIAGVGDLLVIKRNRQPTSRAQGVLGLADLLVARIRQRAFADQYAEPASGQPMLVRRRNAVGDGPDG